VPRARIWFPEGWLPDAGRLPLNAPEPAQTDPRPAPKPGGRMAACSRSGRRSRACWRARWRAGWRDEMGQFWGTWTLPKAILSSKSGLKQIYRIGYSVYDSDGRSLPGPRWRGFSPALFGHSCRLFSAFPSSFPHRSLISPRLPQSSEQGSESGFPALPERTPRETNTTASFGTSARAHAGPLAPRARHRPRSC
jgi:hypothetical protein